MGKILAKVKAVVPTALDVVGDITGIEALDKLSDVIQGDNSVDPKDKEHILTLINLEIQDRNSAREANVEIQISEFASTMAKTVPYIIAIFVSLVWGLMTMFIIAKVFNFIEKEVDLSPVLGIYSGVTAVFVTILNFFFGSSKDSRMKDLERTLNQ